MLLCPWDFPSKNTRVGCHFLLQEIFLAQGSNLHLLCGMWFLYHWTTWEAMFSATLLWLSLNTFNSILICKWSEKCVLVSSDREKAMATHSSTLAWKIPWMEEPGRLQSMGSLRVGHDWVNSLSLFTFMHWRRKWQPTPVFLPGESQGRGEPGGLPSMGSHRIGHDWSDLAAAAAAAVIIFTYILHIFFFSLTIVIICNLHIV